MNDQEFEFYYSKPEEIKKTTIQSVPLHKVAKFDPSTMQGEPSYSCSKNDWAISHRIMDRIMAIATAGGFEINRQALHQDLMTAHCNATPLRMWQLFASETGDFTHDVLGIALHIERTTGRMLNGFTPRFASKT